MRGMGAERMRLQRWTAPVLACLMISMAILPCFPSGFMRTWGFGLVFVNSGSPGHPYLQGTVEGEGNRTWFLCLNEGASAHSNYDYSRVNAGVSYADGTIDQKRLFWAYIGAFGSSDGDSSMNQWKGGCTPEEARMTAWTRSTPAWVEYMANDGFMGLENIPAGCMRPADIFELVSKYNTPEQAMGLSKLCDAPGHISAERLYTMTGLDSWDTFCRYCTIAPYNVPAGFTLSYAMDDRGISFQLVDASGIPTSGINYKPMFRVTYAPGIFRVVSITGVVEYFKCGISGSQQLARARGHAEFTTPEFYLTAGSGYQGGGTPGGGSGTSGGGNPGGGEISVTVYEHEEVFESNYHVELTKRDYETGNPLKDSVWQVLEKFPDQGRLTDNETDGNLREQNMRDAPTTWEEWLVFETDMRTDEEGYISHRDKRFYNYNHKYCDGHPEPEPPESEDDEDDDDDEYERLMEQWEEAVQECEGIAASSQGTFHHWVVGGTRRPSEAEAFEQSGCRGNRDLAYRNFVSLRYSYTFREEDAREGYIIHGQNGHPDDVPIEVMTVQASEAEKEAEWSCCSNEDIRVSGYVRNMDFQDKNNGSSKNGHALPRRIQSSQKSEESINEIEEINEVDEIKEIEEKEIPRETDEADSSERKNYRGFFGLPEKYRSDRELVVNLTAENYVLETEDSDAESMEEELVNDLEDDFESDPESDPETDPESDPETDSGMDMEMNPGKIQATPANLSMEHTQPETVRISFDSVFSSEGEVYGRQRSGGGHVRADAPVADSQSGADEGPHDETAHSWVVYDHRVPGQVHFNKRDLQLKTGESDQYDSYGDTQGDATLEGAVYGLFAADNIYGPDTQRGEDGSVLRGTGVIFDANDLVAVAVTDKNGDGSFMAITEKPHSIYNYETGQIEYTGKEYPKNLYDMDGYRKTYGEEENGRIYRNFAVRNGDCWIGCPLILGSYYIKELTRSEGYELSVTGKNYEVTNAKTAQERTEYGRSNISESHPVGSAWIVQKLKAASTFPEGNELYKNRENLLTVEIGSKQAVSGYDVILDGIPEGAEIYADDLKKKRVKLRVPTGGVWTDAVEAPLYETAQEKVLKRDVDGNYIKNPSAVKDLPIAYTGIAMPAKKLPECGEPDVSDPEKFNEPYMDTEENFQYVKYEAEQMLRSIGAETPKDTATGEYSRPDAPVYDGAGDEACGMPEIVIEVEQVSTNRSLIEKIIDYYEASGVFTYGSLQAVSMEGQRAIVTLSVGMNPGCEALYETDENGNITAGYLFRLNNTTGRYMMKKYDPAQVVVEQMSSDGRGRIYLTPDYEVNEEGLPEDRMMYGDVFEQYLYYNPGEVLYDYCYEDGSGHEKLRRKVYQVTYEEREAEEEEFDTKKVPVVHSREEVADPVKSTYAIYDSAAGQYVIHAGSDGADLSGDRICGFTIALENGNSVITSEDIEKIGENNV